jgi:hypothetical protein
VLLFPEEAKTNGDVMLRFHRKAFVTPYKVQPMVIRFWLLLVPKGSNTVVSGDLWRLLAIPLFVIGVDCLQSIAMEVESKADIRRVPRTRRFCWRIRSRSRRCRGQAMR